MIPSKIMEHIFKVEGGFSDHPNDSGGATMFGITQKNLEAYRGRKVTKEEVMLLPKSEAAEIYFKKYWRPYGMDSIENAGVALFIFDQMVNRGPRTALNAAMKALGVTSVEEINKILPEVAIIKLHEEAKLNYERIVRNNPTQKVFLRGWMNRINNAKNAALSLLTKKEEPMREIESEMIDYLDEKLEKNGLAQQAIEQKNPRLLMIEAPKVCVGIREKSNRNDGPMVELLQKTIGGASNEAWCMSFVQTMIAYAEYKTGIQSLIHPSEHCLTVWKNTPKSQRVKVHPLPGAIAIWQHGKTASGHTGIVLGADNKLFHAVEGNTSEGKYGDKIVREGGGVYFTERSMQKFPNISSNSSMKLVGFLKPF